MTKDIAATSDSGVKAYSTPATFLAEFRRRIHELTPETDHFSAMEHYISVFTAIIEDKPIPCHEGYLAQRELNDLFRVLTLTKPVSMLPVEARSDLIKHMTTAALRHFGMDYVTAGSNLEWSSIRKVYLSDDPISLTDRLKRFVRGIIELRKLKSKSSSRDIGKALSAYVYHISSVDDDDDFKLKKRVRHDLRKIFGIIFDLDKPSTVRDIDLLENILLCAEINVEELVATYTAEDWMAAMAQGDDTHSNDDADGSSEPDDDREDEEEETAAGNESGRETVRLEDHALELLRRMREDLLSEGYSQSRSTLVGVLATLSLFYLGRKDWDMTGQSIDLGEDIKAVASDMFLLLGKGPLCPMADKLLSSKYIADVFSRLDLKPLGTSSLGWLSYIPRPIRDSEYLFGKDDSAMNVTQDPVVFTLGMDVWEDLKRLVKVHGESTLGSSNSLVTLMKKPSWGELNYEEVTVEFKRRK